MTTDGALTGPTDHRHMTEGLDAITGICAVRVGLAAGQDHTVTAGGKTSLLLLLGTVIFVLLALAVVPMHVTLGGGSLRCGTVLNPDSESEIADLCSSARPGHLTAALVAGGALAVIAALPWMASSRLGDAARPLLAIWSVSWMIAASLALLWLASFMEYSPPHEVFDL